MMAIPGPAARRKYPGVERRNKSGITRIAIRSPVGINYSLEDLLLLLSEPE